MLNCLVSREISKPLIPLGSAGGLLVHILTLLCKGMVRSVCNFTYCVQYGIMELLRHYLLMYSVWIPAANISSFCSTILIKKLCFTLCCLNNGRTCVSHSVYQCVWWIYEVDEVLALCDSWMCLYPPNRAIRRRAQCGGRQDSSGRTSSPRM